MRQRRQTPNKGAYFTGLNSVEESSNSRLACLLPRTTDPTLLGDMPIKFIGKNFVLFYPSIKH